MDQELIINLGMINHTVIANKSSTAHVTVSPTTVLAYDYNAFGIGEVFIDQGLPVAGYFFNLTASANIEAGSV